MPTYVYGCKRKTHPRKEVTHKMSENPVILCGKCGKRMHRIPQPLAAVAFDATGVLTEWMDDNYRKWRTKQRIPSPDLVVRPGKPIPAKQYRSRK